MKNGPLELRMQETVKEVATRFEAQHQPKMDGEPLCFETENDILNRGR